MEIPDLVEKTPKHPFNKVVLNHETFHRIILTAKITIMKKAVIIIQAMV